jgi:phenylalanyl-tRNA synthetase beta chain
MRAPLSWLRDFAPLDAPVEDLTAALSNLGLVVDGVTFVGGDLDGVVVAKILEIRTNPDARTVRFVDVDAGDGTPLQIACGAWNMQVGDLVPLATVGTVLPNGMKIGRKKIAGELSNGMLCSPVEVDLPATGDDGLLILPPDIAPPGTPLTEALDLRPDVVFDLDISPNRPDAMSMAGIARDLAAALGEPWALPPSDSVPVDADVPPARVTVEAPDPCPRFCAIVLTGVPTGPSPAWLARRLTLAGMRPINAVVDVSNYVMLDLGQPNHAYDLDRLGGAGLLVRRGRPEEQLVTLDGVTRTLEPDDCVICDAEGTSVGVGGIMGGAAAEISDTTTTVLLEAAYFNPMAIARTGKRLGLFSEARARFERGIDPEIAGVASERFVGLLASLGKKGELRRGPLLDLRFESELPPPAQVLVRTERVNAILGTRLDDADVPRLLTPIGFEAVAVAPGVFSVRVPAWRPDTSREIDVIEEIARLHGYRRIERTVPAGIRGGAGGLTPYQRERRRVRDILTGTALSEAWTTTFLAPGDLERAGLPAAAVEVENPLDHSESILRTELLPGLLKAVRFNADRQNPDVRLFEIGRVFALPTSPGQVTPDEREDVAVVVAGSGVDGRVAARLWAILEDALRLADVRLVADAVPGLHPTRAARVVGAAGQTIGVVGEVDPDVSSAYGLVERVAYLCADFAALVAEPRRPRQARPVSRYPASDVDLAFAVYDTVPAAAVLATLREAGGELLERVELFDVYRGAQVGEARRSLAFRLRFRAPDRTLSDDELAAARQAAIDAVVAAHGAELRG